MPSVSRSPVCVLSTVWTSSGHRSSSRSEVLGPAAAASRGSSTGTRPWGLTGRIPGWESTLECFILVTLSCASRIPAWFLPRSAMSLFRRCRPSRNGGAHHLSPRALSTWLGHGLECQSPAFACWFPAEPESMCQARLAAPRGDPGDSGTQRGPPPPASETAPPPISHSFLNLYLLLALSLYMPMKGTLNHRPEVSLLSYFSDSVFALPFGSFLLIFLGPH